jgi:4-amino-4-deoxy-L-arabinose transferase-like glycosyltransferase
MRQAAGEVLTRVAPVERVTAISQPHETSRRSSGSRATPAGLGVKGIVALIAALALLLRVWAIGQVPVGLDSDEVSLGYNAYSLLRTGRDEYGVPYPTAFRAYGEFKRPAYVYAAIPSVALFGLTPVGVRLPAALAGTLSVVALYAVAAQMLRRPWPAVAAAGFLAISPWHLQFTRAAREVSLLLLALLVLAAALLAAFHARREAGPWYALASGALLLALYSYPGGVLVGPLLVLVFAWAYRGRLRRASRGWLLAAILAVTVGAAPLAAQFVDGRARERLSQASILADPALTALSAARVERDQHDGVPWVLNDRWLLAARRAVHAYLSHFDATYLFTSGDDNWRHRASDSGELYLWDLLPIVVGVAYLMRHLRRPGTIAAAGWLLIGPLPAAFATEAPHAVRAIPMLPAWYLVSAAGLPALWRWLNRRRLHWDWLLLLVASVGFYLYAYYRHYPVEHADAWSSGALEAYQVALAEAESGRFDRVVIPDYLEYSYAYALFATQYDPRTYLAQGGTAQLLTRPISRESIPLRFAPFEMRYVNWDDEPRDPRAIYVLWLIEGRRFPADLRVMRSIQNLGGRDAFWLATFGPAP